MMLTPPPRSHLLWSLSCPLWPQLLMSSTRASPMTRSLYWRESSVRCTISTRRGGDHLYVALSAATPLTSSPTTPSGRCSTPTGTTISSGTTTARTTIRRSTASRTTKRSSRRSCPERVLPGVILTSPLTTPPAQRRMRRSSVSKATSPAFASWANL
jgi:hypothetical protein